MGGYAAGTDSVDMIQNLLSDLEWSPTPGRMHAVAEGVVPSGPRASFAIEVESDRSLWVYCWRVGQSVRTSWRGSAEATVIAARDALSSMLDKLEAKAIVQGDDKYVKVLQGARVAAQPLLSFGSENST